MAAQQLEQTESAAPAPDHEETEEALVDETLVEEVSIDGMCGVY